MSEPVNGARERSEHSEVERCGASERSEQCERSERSKVERCGASEQSERCERTNVASDQGAC